MHSGLQFLLIILYIVLEDANCYFKTFNFHTDITSPDLWVGNKKAKDCSGIIFTQDFHSVYIKHLKADQILLPQHGSIYITDGGYIEINKDFSNTCIKVGAIPLHSYYNPTSWAINNPSIPSIERIPCAHDEVMFPYALNSAVLFDDKIDLRMRHVIMDDTAVEEAYVFRNFLRSGQWPVTAYAEPEVFFTGKQCQEESGCICHEWREQQRICGYVRVLGGADKEGGGRCVDAIEPPVGECGVESFCGGVIHMKPKTGFQMKKLDKLLEDYYFGETVAAYASKVAPDEHSRLIQIVFAEERYTGRSAEVAAEYFKKFSTREMMEELKIFDVKMSASGNPIVVGEAGAAIVGIVFGTLFGVSVVFATIYVCYVGPLKDYNVSKRFTSKPLSRTIGGVRYKSKDEERLVYEGQSMAGSVLSLDRAFDNPMYGHGSASTSTGETTVLHEQNEQNPMFDLVEKQIENVDSEI